MQLSKRAKGRWWKVAGTILVVLGVVAAIAIIAAFSIVSNGKQNSIYVAALIGFWFAAGGVACIRRGQRLSAPTAEELLSTDRRAPVLYLRSFEEDRVTAKWSDFKNVLDFISPYGKNIDLETEEVTLARVMKQIGPFIAIGSPDEELPQLGAARTYVEDGDWHEKTAALIAQAQLVVFRFSVMVTQGVCWEIQKVIELVQPQQLLLLIACLPGEEYEYFRERVNKYFAQPLPDFRRRTIFNKFYEDRINAVIYFNRDWTPQIAPLKGKKKKGELARELERVLTPVARAIGHDWKRPMTMRHRALLLGVAAFSLSPLVIMLLRIWILGSP